MFAGFAAVFVGIMVFVLISFAIPYAVLRMRDARSEKPDPKLGLKAAMYYFFSLGIMLILFGLTWLVMDFLMTEQRPVDWFTPERRVAVAFMISGLFFTIVHLALVKVMTNDRNPAARRMFAGWRMAIHGLVVISVVTGLLAIYIQKNYGDVPERDRKGLWGVLLVWLPSWVIHLVLLWFYSQPLYEPRRSDSGPDWDR
jgi:hypothetical protein